jgi:hypothetical protein
MFGKTAKSAFIEGSSRMSHNTSDYQDCPVTAIDLALYAEGLLDAAGCQRVEHLLNMHPELQSVCAVESEAAENLPFQASTPGWSVTQSLILADSARVPSRRNWVSIAAVTLLLTAVVVAWRETEAGAFDAALALSEQAVHATGERIPVDLLRSRQTLERLQKSFWVSDQQMRRRNQLLAEAILAQAGMELKHVMPMEYIDRPDQYPPLDLCRQAVSLVRGAEGDDPLSRQVLADALRFTSEIHGRFAVVQRYAQNRPYCDQFAQSAAAALEAYEVNADDRQKLALLNLLFRALHKGALSGQLRMSDGQSQSAEAVLMPKLRVLLQGFVADSTESIPTDAQQFVTEIGLAAIRLPVDCFADRLAMMGICNTLGMRLRATPQQAALVLQQGIFLAEQATGVEQDLSFQLTYGRLLGNLADNVSGIVPVVEELQIRERAVGHFRGAVRRIVSEELQAELCWVTARQLLLSYVAARQGLLEESRVAEYLGALKQITAELQSFEGAQLNEKEIELIRAIHADHVGDLSQGWGLKKTAQWVQTAMSGGNTETTRCRVFIAAFRESPYCRSQAEFSEILRAVGLE